MAPWHRYELCEKGILYDPTPAKIGQCPPHVEMLRDSLLDFGYPIAEIQLETLDMILENLDTIGSGKKFEHAAIARAEKNQQTAVRLSSGGSEADWANFFLEAVFDQLAARTVPPKRQNRISSRSGFYYNQPVMETGKPWEICQYQDTSIGQTRDKCPKPDIAFFLPTYQMKSTKSTSEKLSFESSYWEQRPKASLAEHFTWNTLNELQLRGGLQPGPRMMCNERGIDAVGQRRCYPWLIVEFEKSVEGILGAERAKQVVYGQASNAAACALQLNRQVAKYAPVFRDQAHVSCIPTVTTVGSIVTVWTAYYAKDVPKDWRFGLDFSNKQSYDEAYIMQAIWRGDMTNLKSILELDLLLNNIYIWAIRVFKPLIATYLNQWKNVHLQPGLTPKSEDPVAVYQKTAPKVKSLMKEYQMLEAETQQVDDVVNPLKFGLILQQMMMADRQQLLDDMESIMAKRIQDLVNSSGCIHQESVLSPPKKYKVVVRLPHVTAYSEKPARPSSDGSSASLTPISQQVDLTIRPQDALGMPAIASGLSSESPLYVKSTKISGITLDSNTAYTRTPSKQIRAETSRSDSNNSVLISTSRDLSLAADAKPGESSLSLKPDSKSSSYYLSPSPNSSSTEATSASATFGSAIRPTTEDLSTENAKQSPITLFGSASKVLVEPSQSRSSDKAPPPELFSFGQNSTLELPVIRSNKSREYQGVFSSVQQSSSTTNSTKDQGLFSFRTAKPQTNKLFTFENNTVGSKVGSLFESANSTTSSQQIGDLFSFTSSFSFGAPSSTANESEDSQVFSSSTSFPVVTLFGVKGEQLRNLQKSQGLLEKHVVVDHKT